MWLSKDGVVNIVHERSPETFMESNSYELLATASDEELEDVLVTLESVHEDAHEETDRLSWTAEELAFEDEELPENWLIWFDPGDWSLAKRIDDILRSVELRWRLDALSVVEHVIWNIQDERRGSWFNRLIRRVTPRRQTSVDGK
jgi:hypothetical protein